MSATAGLDVERWRDIPGYEGKYQASTEGRVRSLPRTIVQASSTGKLFARRFPGRLKKATVREDGYSHLVLASEFGQQTILTHRVVARTWLVNPMDLPEVNHKNFKKTDNRPTNLEWCDRRENVAHAVAGGKCGGLSKRVIAMKPDGTTRAFGSQVEAEIALLGRITGIVSWALRKSRPAIGHVWYRA